MSEYQLTAVGHIQSPYKQKFAIPRQPRLVPEAKPDSPFFYYVKKPAGGEKAKIKLKAKKYNPSTRKHEVFVEKKLPPHSK